jgi:hypothetical protein
MELRVLTQTLVIIFIGWPALIASLLAWLAGLITKKFIVVVIAGIIILTFSFFYLGAYIGSSRLGLLFSLGHFASAIAVRQNKILLAWLLLAPYTLFVGMLAYIVLTQSIG